MFRTIRSRLIGSYLLVVFLAMGVAATLAWRALDRAFLDVLRENLLAQARRVAQTAEYGLPPQQEALTEAGAPPSPSGHAQDGNELPGETTVVEIDAYPAAEASSQISDVVSGDVERRTGLDVPSTEEAYSQVTNVQPGYHTRLIEAELPASTDTYSQAANVLPGIHTRIVEADEQPVADASSQTTTGSAGFPTPAPNSEVLTGDDVHSQAASAVPDNQIRVVDEEGAVILDLAGIGASAAQAAVAEAQLSGIGEVASRFDLDLTREEQGEPLRLREEIQRAMAGEPATALRAYSWAPDRRVLYAAHPVRAANGSVSSVVYIASPLPRLSLSLLPTYFGPQVLAGIVGATVLAGAAGAVLARTLTRPLHHLTNAAVALARGEQAPPVPEAGTAELMHLTATFNEMNASLAAARRELLARAEEREIIFNSLSDGVIAASGAAEIVLTNPAGAELMEVAPAQIGAAIDEAIAGGQKHATEFAARDRIIELVATPLGEAGNPVGGAVAVAHDVTAHRQLDRLRTRFVSDVSHELRTPLTAIKGFIETLRDGAAEDPVTRDRFLQTIDVETERMIRLASELLLLARADAGRLDLRLAPTELQSLTQRAVDQLAGRAAAKDVSLTIRTDAKPLTVLVDDDRVQQVLINLLDNAVKFTPSGGAISISLRATGKQAVCTVADTGPGIADGELPHLFEQFYRGDRSRARSEGEGGAGLGLAIARAIVDAHGGRIWVEGDSPMGTTISFTLPFPA